MKNATLRTRMGLAGLALVLWSAGPALAADGSAFENLTLRIGTPVASIQPMEALSLVITVENQTDVAVCGHDAIDPVGGLLKLYLASERGPLEQVFSTAGVDILLAFPPETRELQPGYRRSVLTYLWYGDTATSRGKTLFFHAGTYLLKARLASADGKSEIESNVLAIKVVEPGSRDSGAFEFLKQEESKGKRFFDVPDAPQALREGKISQLSEFIRKYPSSRYAAYARYTVGVAHYYGDRKYKDAAADLEQALLEKDFPLSAEVLYYLVASYLNQGDKASANRHLTKLELDYAGSTWAERARNKMSTHDRGNSPQSPRDGK